MLFNRALKRSFYILYLSIFLRNCVVKRLSMANNIGNALWHLYVYVTVKITVRFASTPVVVHKGQQLEKFALNFKRWTC